MTIRHRVIGQIGLGDAGGRANRLGDDGVNREGVFGKDRFVFRGQKGPRCQFQHIVGAVAQGQCRQRRVQPGGQGGFQIKAVAVGITGQPVQRLAHRNQRLGTWPQRIFIRRQLDDVGETVFPAQFAFRFAGLIGLQGADAGRGEREEIAGHGGQGSLQK